MHRDSIKSVLVLLMIVGLVATTSVDAFAASTAHATPQGAPVTAPLDALQITGTVTDTGGAPIAGIQVTASDEGAVTPTTTTTDDGSYSLDVDPGTYTIQFTDDGTYVDGWYDDASATGFSPDEADASSVVVTAANVTGIDVSLPSALLQLSGLVTGPDGDGLAGIEVFAVEGGTGVWTTTGADGTYSLDIVPGTYTVQFTDDSDTYLDGWYDDASASGFSPDQAGATPVVVTDADVTGIDISLPTVLLHISGLVTDTGSAPLAGIEVAANDGSSDTLATTGADGTYSLDVAAGAYTIQFTDPAGTYVTGWYAGGGFSPDETDATQVFVTDADVTGIDIRLPSAPRQISGLVTGPDGDGLAGIEVFASTADAFFQTTTGADGTYSLDVDPGTYTVEFTDDSGTYVNGWYAAGGFSPDQAGATPVVVTDADVTGIDISLPTVLLHISGLVTDTGSAPLAGIEVAANDGSSDTLATTGADGTYSLDVAPGAYTIQFTDPAGTYVTGWYAGGGFTSNEDDATPVVVTDADVTGIDISLPKEADVPAAPTGVSATPGNASATVSWLAPADNGGSSITRYTVTSAPGAKTCTTTVALFCTVSGLTNGTAYTFTVKAANTLGTGAASAASAAVTPRTVPSAPTGVSATPGNATATVSWTATFNGGSSITGYTVISAPGAKTCSTTGALSCTVSGLTNGTSYTFTVKATNIAGTGAASAASAAVKPTAPVVVSGSTYHAVNPARLLDTRTGNGLAGNFQANVARTFQVTGRGGVPAGATAVTGNLTVTGQTGVGSLFVGPVATNTPGSSTLNFPVADNRANGVTVGLGSGGKLSITYSSSAGKTTAVVFDVTGYFTADATGSTYHAVNPARLLDTRTGNGLAGNFQANVARTFQVSGRGGVPAGATAVTGNLTVTGQTGVGSLFVGPVATNTPGSSTLNFPVADNRANGVTVGLGSGGKLSITYSSSAGKTTAVVFDVTGYFTADATGSTYHAVNPARLLDTRTGNGLAGNFQANVARTFQVSGRGGVPAGATAVTGNLTVTGQTGVGSLFVGPVATNTPGSSTLNFPVADNRANGVTVGLGSGGKLSITYSSSAGKTTAVVFDVTGYFTP